MGAMYKIRNGGFPMLKSVRSYACSRMNAMT
jgi:hypothetical protein